MFFLHSVILSQQTEQIQLTLLCSWLCNLSLSTITTVCKGRAQKSWADRQTDTLLSNYKISTGILWSHYWLYNGFLKMYWRVWDLSKKKKKKVPHSDIKKIWDNLKLLHCLSWDSFWPPFNLFPKPTMILYIVSCLQNESEWQTLSSWTNSGHNSCGIYIHCKYSYHAHFPPSNPQAD